MPFLELGEVRIYYETFGEGNGRWVTIVGAYARPLTDYRAMARFLAEHGFRALVCDNRGAGKAECPPSFTLADLVGDFVSTWNHLGIAESFVVGLGYGGVIAAHLAAEHPTRARGLVLVGTPCTEAALAVETKSPARDPRHFLANVARYFSAAFVTANGALVQGYARQLAKIFQEPDTAIGATCQRAAMDGMDLRPLLGKIRAPTLVIHGEQDRLVDLESAKALSAGIPDAKLEWFSEGGHLLIAEAPRKLYESVEAFCRSVG